MDVCHFLHSGYYHPVVKSWQTRCNRPCKDNLIFPIFVTDSTENEPQDVKSLPGQKRYPVHTLVESLRPLVEKGLKSVILFGVIDRLPKTETGDSCDSDDNPVMQALPLLSKAFPDLLLCTDVCICAYTSHGHCGIMKRDPHRREIGESGDSCGEEYIDNLASIERISEMALKHAQRGAHVVAPSDMMDGRIKAIKDKLMKHNLYSRVAVMSYSAKFASCFYGPFRDAAKSAPSKGDRSRYQLPPSSSGLANRALKRDIAEGADIVMIKPGMPYLDVIKDARNGFPDYPVAVYQVSGEYAMIIHAANQGTFDLKRAVLESIISFHRAGADIILTYFTPYLLDIL